MRLPEVVGAFDLPPYSPRLALGPEGASGDSGRAAVHRGPWGWLGQGSER